MTISWLLSEMAGRNKFRPAADTAGKNPSGTVVTEPMHDPANSQGRIRP